MYLQYLAELLSNETSQSARASHTKTQLGLTIYEIEFK